jgi:trigger factor
MAQSDIKITLRTWKRSLQKTDRHKYGQKIQGEVVVARVLSNQDEVKKLSDQVVAEIVRIV